MTSDTSSPTSSPPPAPESLQALHHLLRTAPLQAHTCGPDEAAILLHRDYLPELRRGERVAVAHARGRLPMLVELALGVQGVAGPSRWALADAAVRVMCGKSAAERAGTHDAQTSTLGPVWDAALSRTFFERHRGRVGQICSAMSTACERLEEVVLMAMAGEGDRAVRAPSPSAPTTRDSISSARVVSGDGEGRLEVTRSTSASLRRPPPLVFPVDGPTPARVVTAMSAAVAEDKVPPPSDKVGPPWAAPPSTTTTTTATTTTKALDDLPAALDEWFSVIHNALLLLESLLVAVVVEDGFFRFRLGQSSFLGSGKVMGVGARGAEPRSPQCNTPSMEEEGCTWAGGGGGLTHVHHRARASPSPTPEAGLPVALVVECATRAFVRLFLSLTTMEHQLTAFGARHGAAGGPGTSTTAGEPHTGPGLHMSSAAVSNTTAPVTAAEPPASDVGDELAQRFHRVGEAMRARVAETMRLLKLTTISIAAHDADIAEAAISYIDRRGPDFTAQATMLLAHVLTPELLAAHPTDSRGGRAIRWILSFVFGGCDGHDVARTQRLRELARVDSDPFSIADSSLGSGGHLHSSRGSSSSSLGGDDDVRGLRARPTVAPPRDSDTGGSNYSFGSSGTEPGAAGESAGAPLSDTYAAIGLRVEYILAACFTRCHPLMTVIGVVAEGDAYECGTVVAKAVLQYAVTLSHTSARLMRAPLLTTHGSTPFTEAMMRGLCELAQLPDKPDASSSLTSEAVVVAAAVATASTASAPAPSSPMGGEECCPFASRSVGPSGSGPGGLSHDGTTTAPTPTTPTHTSVNAAATATMGGCTRAAVDAGKASAHHEHHRPGASGGAILQPSHVSESETARATWSRREGVEDKGLTGSTGESPSDPPLAPLARVCMRRRQQRYHVQPRVPVTGTTPADRAESAWGRTHRRTTALQWAKCVVLSARTLLRAGIAKVPVPREHYETLCRASERLQGMLTEWLEQERELRGAAAVGAAPAALASAQPFSALARMESTDPRGPGPGTGGDDGGGPHPHPGHRDGTGGSPSRCSHTTASSALSERYQQAFAHSFCFGKDAGERFAELPFVNVPIHEVLFASCYSILDAVGDVLLCEEPRLNSIVVNEFITLLYELRLSMLEAHTNVQLITSQSERFRCLSERDAVTLESAPAPQELLFPAEYAILMTRALRCEAVIARWRADLARDANHPAAGYASLLFHLHRRLSQSEHPTDQELLISRATLRLLLGATARDEAGNMHGNYFHVDDLDVTGTRKEEVAPRLGLTASMDVILSSRDDLRQLVDRQRVDGGVYRSPLQGGRTGAGAPLSSAPSDNDDDDDDEGTGEASTVSAGAATATPDGGGRGGGGRVAGQEGTGSDRSGTSSWCSSSNSDGTPSADECEQVMGGGGKGGRPSSRAAHARRAGRRPRSQRRPRSGRNSATPAVTPPEAAEEAALSATGSDSSGARWVPEWLLRINESGSGFCSDSLAASPLFHPAGEAASVFPTEEELARAAGGGVRGGGVSGVIASAGVMGRSGMDLSSTLPPMASLDAVHVRGGEGPPSHRHHPRNGEPHPSRRRLSDEPARRSPAHSVKIIGSAEELMAIARRAPRAWGLPTAAEVLARADAAMLAREPRLAAMLRAQAHGGDGGGVPHTTTPKTPTRAPTAVAEGGREAWVGSGGVALAGGRVSAHGQRRERAGEESPTGVEAGAAAPLYIFQLYLSKLASPHPAGGTAWADPPTPHLAAVDDGGGGGGGADTCDWNLRRFDPHRPAAWTVPAGQLPSARHRDGIGLLAQPTTTTTAAPRAQPHGEGGDGGGVAAGRASCSVDTTAASASGVTAARTGRLSSTTVDSSSSSSSTSSSTSSSDLSGGNGNGVGGGGSGGSRTRAHSLAVVAAEPAGEARTLVRPRCTRAKPAGRVSDAPPRASSCFDLSRMPNARRLLEATSFGGPPGNKSFSFVTNSTPFLRSSDDEDRGPARRRGSGSSDDADGSVAGDRVAVEVAALSRRGSAGPLLRHSASCGGPLSDEGGHDQRSCGSSSSSRSHSSQRCSPGRGAQSSDSGERVPLLPQTTTTAAAIVRDSQRERNGGRRLPRRPTAPSFSPTTSPSSDGGGTGGVSGGELAGRNRESPTERDFPSGCSPVSAVSAEGGAFAAPANPVPVAAARAPPTPATTTTTTTTTTHNNNSSSSTAAVARREGAHAERMGSGTTAPHWPTPVRSSSSAALAGGGGGVAVGRGPFGRRPPSTPASPVSTGSATSTTSSQSYAAPASASEGGSAVPVHRAAGTAGSPGVVTLTIPARAQPWQSQQQQQQRWYSEGVYGSPMLPQRPAWHAHPHPHPHPHPHQHQHQHQHQQQQMPTLGQPMVSNVSSDNVSDIST